MTGLIGILATGMPKPTQIVICCDSEFSILRKRPAIHTQRVLAAGEGGYVTSAWWQATLVHKHRAKFNCKQGRRSLWDRGDMSPLQYL